MKKIMKKLAVLVAATVLTLTSLAGCGVKDDAVVMTVGDTKVTADMVQFYARYMQPSYEEYMISMISYQYQMYYGSTLDLKELDWDTAYTEDATYTEDFLNNYVVNTLKNFYLAQENMSEYKVELTEEDKKAIAEAAKAFDKANDAETKEAVSANEELVTEYLTLATIYKKVEDAILATVDRNVSDDDAKQKKMRYVSFAKTETDDSGATVELSKDDLAKVKKEAEDFLAAAKANGNLEAYAKEKEATATAATFGADYADDTSLTLDKAVYKAADALTEVGFTELIDTENAYYVVQVESLFDKEATEAEKEAIIEERETKKVTEVFEAWEKADGVEIDEKVLSKIDIGSLKVTMPEEEKEESADDKTDAVDKTDTTDKADTTKTEE